MSSSRSDVVSFLLVRSSVRPFVTKEFLLSLKGFNSVPRKFKGCLKFKGCYKEFSRMFQGSFKFSNFGDVLPKRGPVKT